MNAVMLPIECDPSGLPYDDALRHPLLVLLDPPQLLLQQA